MFFYNDDWLPCFSCSGDADSYVRLPTFVDPCHLESYYLTDIGITTAKKLLSIISHERPDIVFCPLLYGLTCLLLHYLDEQSCYDCINYIISSKEKFIAQTRTAHEASVLVLKELTRKYAVSENMFSLMHVAFILN